VQAYLPRTERAIFISSQEKSDVVHDLLAFLAERMLKMNKENRRRSRLPCLAGVLPRRKCRDLTPKTAARRATTITIMRAFKRFKEDRKKLAIDPARREPAEALKSEFEGSLGELLPLLERTPADR
jgi:hypothetical protein